MATPRSDGMETKRRLLEAAAVLFAAHGFRRARTAEICRLAKANSAAVNYHFGSKERLYAAAWRHAFDRSLEAYPPHGGIPGTAPAEERLRGHIAATVRRFLDPASIEADIADRELADPTGLLADVMCRSIEPLRAMHRALVRELLGPGATAEDVKLCVLSIQAQCPMALMQERRRCRMPPELRHVGPSPLGVGVGPLTDHVVRFSLAGIRDVRRARQRVAGRAAGARKAVRKHG